MPALIAKRRGRPPLPRGQVRQTICVRLPAELLARIPAPTGGLGAWIEAAVRAALEAGQAPEGVCLGGTAQAETSPPAFLDENATSPGPSTAPGFLLRDLVDPRAWRYDRGLLDLPVHAEGDAWRIEGAGLVTAEGAAGWRYEPAG